MIKDYKYAWGYDEYSKEYRIVRFFPKSNSQEETGESFQNMREVIARTKQLNNDEGIYFRIPEDDDTKGDRILKIVSYILGGILLVGLVVVCFYGS